MLSLLNIITEVREDLRWKIEDGVVMFVTAEELTGGQVLRMYEVRDLIRAVTDFPGREINIQPSGGVPEVDDELEEREGLVLTEDALDTLLFRVDQDYDGEWDADAIGAMPEIIYETPGPVAMVVEVMDPFGATAADVVLFEVAELPTVPTPMAGCGCSGDGEPQSGALVLGLMGVGLAARRRRQRRRMR